jgi:hypothetical protein
MRCVRRNDHAQTNRTDDALAYSPQGSGTKLLSVGVTLRNSIRQSITHVVDSEVAERIERYVLGSAKTLAEKRSTVSAVVICLSLWTPNPDTRQKAVGSAERPRTHFAAIARRAPRLASRRRHKPIDVCARSAGPDWEQSDARQHIAASAGKIGIEWRDCARHYLAA